MKSNRLLGSILVFYILLLTIGQSHAQQYSPEFQSLLNQIQQNYLAPKGENLSSMRNQYPSIVAALIGHALRQQMIHVQQNPSLKNQFQNLTQEARRYITDVAKTTSYRGKNEDGSPLTPDSLWFVVGKFFQGQEDAWILQNFRVQTGTMPSVLAARSRPRQPGRPVGALVEKEEKNQIELFGIGAPSVKGWPQATSPSQPPPKQITLNPDGIVGTWFDFKREFQLKVWKQGDMFLGSASGKRSIMYNFVSDPVSLRLKYAGTGKYGPVYKGQCYMLVGTLSSIKKWEDVTFYYKIAYGKETFSNSESSIGTMDFNK